MPSVRKVDELSGPGVEAAVAEMKPGDVLLLENSRFDPREEKNDPSLVEELARLGDIYVNDAFSAAHRAHATTAGLADKLPAVAGLLMEQELRGLDGVLADPKKPLVVVLGGAKVTDKIKVIDRFLDLADQLLIGGAMSFAFLKAKGLGVGSSKVEEEGVAVAAAALDKAAKSSCELVLPSDFVVAEAFDENAATKVVAADAMPEGWMGLDIGPETSRCVCGCHRQGRHGLLERSHGCVRDEAFRVWDAGGGSRPWPTCPGVTVVGGGDSVAAVNLFGVADKMDHVSMGGGASLEYIEGAELPGVAVLADLG